MFCCLYFCLGPCVILASSRISSLPSTVPWTAVTGVQFFSGFSVQEEFNPRRVPPSSQDGKLVCNNCMPEFLSALTSLYLEDTRESLQYSELRSTFQILLIYVFGLCYSYSSACDNHSNSTVIMVRWSTSLVKLWKLTGYTFFMQLNNDDLCCVVCMMCTTCEIPTSSVSVWWNLYSSASPGSTTVGI